MLFSLTHDCNDVKSDQMITNPTHSGCEVKWFNLLLTLDSLLSLFNPCRLLLRLRLLWSTGKHIVHEKLLHRRTIKFNPFANCLQTQSLVHDFLLCRVTKHTFARAVKNRASWYSSGHSKSRRKLIGLRSESNRSIIDELWPSGPSASNYSRRSGGGVIDNVGQC